MSSGEAQPALLNAFLLSTKDALMVFEAARRGICPVVTRRLGDSEKSNLIVSGSVFAFDEQSTGIKRWTDGALWSPSRIIGNYLIYRELDKKGDKEANRPSTHSTPGPIARSPHGQPSDPFDATKDSGPSSSQSAADGRPSSSIVTGSTGLHRELERALVGSLTTSYRFKKDGLIKKTISNGHLHLISYYTIDDVLAGRLRTPSSLIELASLEISPALLDAKYFRMPPVTEKDMEGNLRYIGEDSDPVGAPPILAPLLAPGSVAAARPLSAVGDSPYSMPANGTLPPYETGDSHLFAFKPLDEAIYPPARRDSNGRDVQTQHNFEHQLQRRPDTAQPLWSQRYTEEIPPIAGPSSWRERQMLPYTHNSMQTATVLPMQAHQPHLQSLQPYFHEPEAQYRPLLQRSHSGVAPSYGEQPYYATGQRPMTQFRRQSYRPPSAAYPNPSRSSEPYSRPVAMRPATSPAPSLGMYSMSSSFNDPRGSVSAKTEPDSPGIQHVSHIPYQQSQQHPFHRAPVYPHYEPSPPSGQSGSYFGMQPPPPSQQAYSSSEVAVQSAPPHIASDYPYHESAPSHYQEPQPRAPLAPPYYNTHQETQSAPPYADTFQQRSSYAGPMRQRMLLKMEDPS